MLQATRPEYDIAQDLNDADIPSLAAHQTEQVIHDSLTYELHAFQPEVPQTKFGADAATIVKAVKLDRPRGHRHRPLAATSP